ncbi:MAG: hypothetical protein E7Z91_06845 [Cyanobacteria bacterium SIG30]|nr:hypothetical protein [Cyanobacteria bacterium SIG30]
MKKIIPILAVLFILIKPTFAVNYEDLNAPKPTANRIGTGESPEEIIIIKTKDFEQNDSKIKNKEKNKDINAYDMTYADLSLKRIALDVLDEFDEEKEEILNDLSDMWVAVAGNSETMQYTIYKLSNPDEDKPDENLIKKIIRPVASLSTIAGTAFSANPFVASGAMIGGNLLSAFTSSNKDLNYQFTKVSDADMVILVRKIDDLQKKMMSLYMDYRTKKKIYEMAVENVKKREEIYKNMQNMTREEIIVTDVYLRNAQNAETKARNDYWASRNILGQLVGNNVLDEIENRKNNPNESETTK